MKKERGCHDLVLFYAYAVVENKYFIYYIEGENQTVATFQQITIHFQHEVQLD
ncbi:MAG: hypothetical protein K0S80_1992 [Neobacillus sp.]|nr:hypothetical protein [Neobacillus sp.]